MIALLVRPHKASAKKRRVVIGLDTFNEGMELGRNFDRHYSTRIATTKDLYKGSWQVRGRTGVECLYQYNPYEMRWRNQRQPGDNSDKPAATLVGLWIGLGICELDAEQPQAGGEAVPATPAPTTQTPLSEVPSAHVMKEMAAIVEEVRGLREQLAALGIQAESRLALQDPLKHTRPGQVILLKDRKPVAIAYTNGLAEQSELLSKHANIGVAFQGVRPEPKPIPLDDPIPAPKVASLTTETSAIDVDGNDTTPPDSDAALYKAPGQQTVNGRWFAILEQGESNVPALIDAAHGRPVAFESPLYDEYESNVMTSPWARFKTWVKKTHGREVGRRDAAPAGAPNGSYARATFFLKPREAAQ